MWGDRSPPSGTGSSTPRAAPTGVPPPVEEGGSHEGFTLHLPYSRVSSGHCSVSADVGAGQSERDLTGASQRTVDQQEG